jgi:hypothetical protein
VQGGIGAAWLWLPGVHPAGLCLSCSAAMQGGLLRSQEQGPLSRCRRCSGWR